MWQKMNQADNTDTQRGSFIFTENLIIPVEYFKLLFGGYKASHNIVTPLIRNETTFYFFPCKFYLKNDLTNSFKFLHDAVWYQVVIQNKFKTFSSGFF